MTMRAHSMAMQESLRGYTFGSAFGHQLQSHGFTDAQVRELKSPILVNAEEGKLQELAPSRVNVQLKVVASNHYASRNCSNQHILFFCATLPRLSGTEVRL